MHYSHVHLWNKTDIQILQRKMRTLLTKRHMHNPRSTTERTILPRYIGGRGIIDIFKQMNNQIRSLRSYFYKKAETSNFYRTICEVGESSPLKLINRELQLNNQSDEDKIQ